MQQGTTVMSEVCFETVKELHIKIQKKKAWDANMQYSAPP
jgi:hypothetical protein